MRIYLYLFMIFIILVSILGVSPLKEFSWGEQGKVKPIKDQDKIVILQHEISDLKKSLKDMQLVIEAQQAILDELKKDLVQPPATPTIQPSPRDPDSQAASKSGLPSLAALNPNISAIGDFTGNMSDDERSEEGDRFGFREVELGFQAAVDPYARADFFVATEEGEEGEIETDVEEGHLTLLTLPWGLQAKLGKFYANFGKINRIHRPERPYIDDPLFIKNFFGEEGRLSSPGVSLSSLIPNPWDKYMELSVEILNGENESSFAGKESDHPIYLAHLKNFFDLSDLSSLELGLTGATGFNDSEGDQRTTLEGLDLTYRWRPLGQGLYRSFIFQTEALFNQRETESRNINSFGFYSFANYQFSRRWYLGGRLEYSEFPSIDIDNEWGYSGILTFFPSEFSRFRLQYNHIDRNYEKDEDQILFQATFTLGPHRPEPF